VRLSANDAFIRGGAVDVDFSELHWNEGCDFPPASDVLCTAADGCNRIDHNVTTADRGIIDVNRDNSVAELSRVYLTDNTAGSAILIGGAASVPSNLILRDSVVARNNLAHVVHVRPGVIPQGDGITVAEGITVTGNNLSNNLSARVFNVPETAAFTLRNAIIDQPSRLLKLPFVGHVLQRVMTTASYSSAVTPTNDYFIAAPIFAGTVDDRYLQSPNSPGVDAAPAAGGLDIEGTPRDQDVPDVSNGPGPRDLGAFETASVLLFGNGFE
jgi:hypothetical protein